MFSKRFKKALSVIAASAVIASCTSATMPVSAFVDSPGITQVYSIKNYDAEREFSVKRLGSLHSYSFNTLYMGCGSNDRIPTGIWASEGMKLKVYVKAQNGDAILFQKIRIYHFSLTELYQCIEHHGSIKGTA